MKYMQKENLVKLKDTKYRSFSGIFGIKVEDAKGLAFFFLLKWEE